MPFECLDGPFGFVLSVDVMWCELDSAAIAMYGWYEFAWCFVVEYMPL